MTARLWGLGTAQVTVTAKQTVQHSKYNMFRMPDMCTVEAKSVGVEGVKGSVHSKIKI